jgi:MPBQ/MSBQ methyltransferase
VVTVANVANIAQLDLPRVYDKHLEFDFFGLADSDFWNYGYWYPETVSHVEACENLLALLVDRIDKQPGMILDVACGKGAATGWLGQRFSGSEVVGVNISPAQLDVARRLHPNVSFKLSDATSLPFEDGSVDCVLCVEAAVHFDTRLRFFAEAHRVLASGGWLLMSDVLMAPWAPTMPVGNFIPSTEAYRDALLDTGFCDVEVVEVRDKTWSSLAREVSRFTRWAWAQGEQSGRDLAAAHRWLVWMDAAIESYVLSAARRPARNGGAVDRQQRELLRRVRPQ